MNHLEHVIDNNGVRIHCLEFNSKVSGIPLVVVPGMINSAEEVATEIGEYLHRWTIILSLRGRGKSDSPVIGWRLEDQSSDIAAVIAHFGFDKVVLFGHSTGASIAARSLPILRTNVRGFIIGDFAPYYPPYHEQWKQNVLEFADRHISDIALNGIVAEAQYTDVSEYLKPIESNVLLLTGDPEQSALQPGEIAKFTEMFPLLRVEVLSGCGHEFLSDNPRQSVEVIERFISSREATV